MGFSLRGRGIGRRQPAGGVFPIAGSAALTFGETANLSAASAPGSPDLSISADASSVLQKVVPPYPTEVYGVKRDYVTGPGTPDAWVLEFHDTVGASSVYFGNNPQVAAPGNYDHGLRTAVPTGFGSGGNFSHIINFRLNADRGIGDTEVNQNLWSSRADGMYLTANWWWYITFLLDGHNNPSRPAGTYSIGIRDSGRMVWMLGNGNTAAARIGELHAVESSIRVLDNLWHQLLLRYEFVGANTVMTMFLDGVNVGSETIVGAQVDMWATYWSGGLPDGGWYYGAEKQAANGTLVWSDAWYQQGQEVFINRAISDAEAANWANHQFSGTEPGVIGMNNWDAGSGTTIAAEVGTSTVSLVNMPSGETDVYWIPEGPHAVVANRVLEYDNVADVATINAELPTGVQLRIEARTLDELWGEISAGALMSERFDLTSRATFMDEAIDAQYTFTSASFDDSQRFDDPVPGGTTEKLGLDQTIRLSGGSSLYSRIIGGEGTNPGGSWFWRFPDVRVAGGRVTPKDWIGPRQNLIYMQFAARFDGEYLNFGHGTSNDGRKLAVLSHQGFQADELVIDLFGDSGIPILYSARDGFAQAAPGNKLELPSGETMVNGQQISSLLDRRVPANVTVASEWRQRYGGETGAGSTAYSNAQIDADSSMAHVPKVREDRWFIFEVMSDLSFSGSAQGLGMTKLWGMEIGGPPQLISGWLTGNGFVNTVDYLAGWFGVRPPDSYPNTQTLTGGARYDHIVWNTSPIPFGGYSLPYPGRQIPPWYPRAGASEVL